MKRDHRHARKASLETHDASKQRLRKCMEIAFAHFDESASYGDHVMLSLSCSRGPGVGKG